jgi:hypothetical protein
MNAKSAFATLNAINCNEHTEKKGNLTYLSWAWAWKMVKDNFPEASYTIYEDANGIPYFTDGKTCWVKTGVTINGLEHIEYLPIMDFKNQSIPLERVTSMDMNKTIQRSLTKACARHGLGLYIYAGEDLPDSSEEQPTPQPTQPSQAVQKRREAAGRGRPQQPRYTPVEPSLFNKMVENYVHGVKSKSGEDYRSAWISYTHAGEAEIAMFDKAVDDYMMATGMVAPGGEFTNI